MRSPRQSATRHRRCPTSSAPTSPPTTRSSRNQCGRPGSPDRARPLLLRHDGRAAMKMGFRRQSMAYAGAVVLFFPLAGEAALADAPVETAIKDLVASIDSSSDWSAAYRNLAYDAVSDTAVVSGLSIATKNGNAKIDFESIQVAGYAAAADGGFTA